MALTQISTDGIKNGTITGTDLATNVDLVDNQRLRLGTGNDLQIFHNGTHTFIQESGSGALQIRGANLILDNADGSKRYIDCNDGGSVELYFNGSKKFETRSDGGTITGDLLVDSGGGNNITLQTSVNNANDSNFIFNKSRNNNIVQTGDDLGTILFKGHDGTDHILAARIIAEVDDTPGTNDMPGRISFATTADGASSLTNRLQIKSDGKVRIPNDTGKFTCGDGDDLQIYHDGSNSYIQDAGTGVLIVKTNALAVKNAAGDENLLYAQENVGVELFYDNSKKFETTSTGAEVSSTTDATFKINNTEGSGTSRLTLSNTGSTNCHFSNTNSELTIGHTVSEIEIKAIYNGAVELYHNNVKKFETTSAGINVEGSITADDIITAGALLHEGDTDTLVHFSAANTIQLKTGGSSRLLVNNFGINLENGYLNTNGNRIILGDSSGATDDRIIFGNNNDLEIYHAGTNSQIDNNTGDLNIRSDIIRLRATNNEQHIACLGDGSVELYFDGSERFKTITDGVQIVDTGNTPVLRWEGASDNILGRIDCNQLSPTTSEMRFYTERSGSLAEAMRLTTNGQLLLLRTSTALGAGETMSVQSRHASTGDNSHIMSWRGDSDAISIRNQGGGDYEFTNSQQGNQISLYDGTGGARMEYANNGNYIGLVSDYTASNRVYSRTTTSAANVHVGSQAYLRRSTSSQRYKNNIREYAGKGIEILKNIIPKTWEDHEDGTTNNGFIAEEFHNAGLTSAVLYEPYIGGEEIGIGEEKGDFYGNGTPPVTKTGEALDDEVLVVDGIDQTTIIAELVIAVKQLNSRLEALEK